ncbi:S-layer protein [Halotia branconii]|uniref:S-layer protein n=1 Tax=Halotia branconii CENA392 TaxID=1539056 RepID=A0AAJ6NUV2_9CYAN|nr:S-layer protein [Halotia branconii]WGV27052.1 S-layer protein [Halotia branconii CENA392]
MNRKCISIVIIVIATTGLIAPVKAQEDSNTELEKSNQVINACVQNQAQTLPNPFSDVPSDHWAFKAVMTMHYCGAFRQATPPALFEKFRPTESQQQPSQPEQQLQK